MGMKLVVVLALIALAPGVVLAQSCDRATVAKLAMVAEAAPADRDVLCAIVGALPPGSSSAFAVTDYANVVIAGQALRKNGYGSRTMYVELIGLAGVRSSADLTVLTAAYARSGGCVTPSIVFDDMHNAIKADKRAAKMFRGWNRDGFTGYLSMVSQANGCRIN